MRKTYSAITWAVMSVIFVPNANGVVWDVTVVSNAFSPATLPNVNCGDTIRWTLALSFDSHTTTSTSIPAGATPWDELINSSTPTYEYVVPNIAGVYDYICLPHGFTGSFTVTCSVGVGENVQNVSSDIYPNPFSSKVMLRDHDADELKIFNINGEIIKVISLNPSDSCKEIELNELAPGMYFFVLLKEGFVKDTKLLLN